MNNSDASSTFDGNDAFIAEQSPLQIGSSSYWEYIVDLKSSKMRRPTPTVRQLH